MQTSIFDNFALPEKGIFTGEPPFPLFVDQREFICAQIPGLESTDYFLIELLRKDTPEIRLVIEIYCREREFIQKIKFIKEELFTNVKPKFDILVNRLTSALQGLDRIHILLLNSLSRVLYNPITDYYIFFNEIIHTVNVVALHQSYIEKYLDIEPMVQAFSLTYSDRLFAGHPVIYMLREPFRYLSDISNLMLKATSFIRINKKAELQDFANNCKNILNAADSLPMLEKIAKNFIIEPFPIVENGRRFIRQGICLKHCRKDVTERAIVLFSDVFVYAQPHRGMWMVPAVYPLNKMKLLLKTGENFLLNVFTPRKSFILQFKSLDEAKSWYDTMDNAIAVARFGDETDFDVAPLWQPDKTTTTCSICHQEHTIFNRRHHCRSCGAVACSECLKYRVVVKEVSDKPVMVCLNCYNKLGDGK